MRGPAGRISDRNFQDAPDPSGRSGIRPSGRLTETINLLALATGSLGKIALDVMIMAPTEFAKLYEPLMTGRGASPTKGPVPR